MATPVSAQQLAAALRQRRGALEFLPPSDFVRGFIDEIGYLCSMALPTLDEPLARHGGVATSDAIDLNYSRPSVGRGRDFGWRMCADEQTFIVQIATADFGWQSVAFLREVLIHRFARLSEALLAARRNLSGLAVRLNGASLDIEAIAAGLKISDEVKFEGDVFVSFDASYSLQLSVADVPDLADWLRRVIDALTPVYGLLAPPSALFAGDPPEDEEAGYPEGSASFRTHRQIERDPKVILEAKRQFRLRNSDRLFCEVCGFDFLRVYGERGRNFAEGHHTKPVSQMKPGDLTTVSDIVIVCSNCHRMLHRSPMVLPSELRQILEATRNR